MKTLPARLFICPACGYQNQYRWVLKNHLVNSHHLGKRIAAKIAAENEYWANPVKYRRVSDDEEICLEDEG